MPILSGFDTLSSSLALEGERNGPCGKPEGNHTHQSKRDPLLRVHNDRYGKSEDRRAQCPDTQKVVRLFGQVIWTTKKCIGYIF